MDFDGHLLRVERGDGGMGVYSFSSHRLISFSGTGVPDMQLKGASGLCHFRSRLLDKHALTVGFTLKFLQLQRAI